MKSRLISIFSDEYKLSRQLKREIKELAIDILTKEEFKSREISIVLSNGAQLLNLNEKYANIDETTDVLTFDLCEDENDVVEGEIYINTELAELQAKQNSLSVEEEILNLAAHGMLHLCKYDHQTDEEYKEMLALGSAYVNKVLTRRLIGN